MRLLIGYGLAVLSITLMIALVGFLGPLLISSASLYGVAIGIITLVIGVPVIAYSFYLTFKHITETFMEDSHV